MERESRSPIEQRNPDRFKGLDLSTEGIPPGLFEAFKHANSRYPNSQPGIVTLLGRELFNGAYDLQKFVDSKFSEAQLAEFAEKMNADHRAVSVRRVTKGEHDAPLFGAIPYQRLTGLWRSFKGNVLIAALNYSERALQGGSVAYELTNPDLNTYSPGPERMNSYLLQHLAPLLEERPQLREELAELFNVFNEALESPEMQKAYGKFWRFLNLKRNNAVMRIVKPRLILLMRGGIAKVFAQQVFRRMQNNPKLSWKPRSAKALSRSPGTGM